MQELDFDSLPPIGYDGGDTIAAYRAAESFDDIDAPPLNIPAEIAEGWLHALEELALSMPGESFDAYLDRCEVTGFAEGVLTLRPHNARSLEKLANKYAEYIFDFARFMVPGLTSITYAIGG